MTTDPELTRIVRSWLAEGVIDVPDRVLDSVMARLPATPQRRRWLPARRELSMNTYLRFAAALAVVSILVVGGIALMRPSLSGGPPAASPTSSPSKLLPLAPAAWCEYVKDLDVLGTPGPPYLPALEKATSGDLTDWKRVGPDLLVLAREARAALAKLEGLAPLAAETAQEARTLDDWIAALDASLAPDAGVPEINQLYNKYDVWQGNRIRWIDAMETTYETACP